MSIKNIFLISCLLSFTVHCLAMTSTRVVNATESTQIENATISDDDKNTLAPLQNSNRLRQEIEEAAGGLAEGIGELQGIGSNVGHILNGVLNGNIDSIFKGTAGFIEEEEAREAVQDIFNGLSKPLTQILSTGYNYTKQYLGITTPSPLGANGTMLKLNGTRTASTPKTIAEDPEVPEPPGPPPPPPGGVEEDPEDGSESEVNVIYKNIVNATALRKVVLGPDGGLYWPYLTKDA